MKIATYNIDWLRNRKLEIEKILNETDFDFLILTEAIDINLRNYKYNS
jgi:exonuclease III